MKNSVLLYSYTSSRSGTTTTKKYNEEKKKMSFRRGYAFGSDAVGPVDAAEIEESSALRLFAEVPPEDPAVAANVLLGLEPAQALALYQASSFYQEICDSEDFRERYMLKWIINVNMTSLRADTKVYPLFRTRVLGDANGLYERDIGLARTEYTLSRWGGRRQVVPTAQSSLGGMADCGGGRDDAYWILMVDVAFYQAGAPLLMHWFANGETIELSE